MEFMRSWPVVDFKEPEILISTAVFVSQLNTVALTVDDVIIFKAKFSGQKLLGLIFLEVCFILI